MRRAALGIVNIIVNSGLDISLKELVNVSLDALEEDGVLKTERTKVEADVLEFLKQRIINIFTDMKYRKDIIAAVLDRNADNIINSLEIVKTITEKITKDKFIKLLQTVKRVSNIVKNNKTKDIKEELFKNDFEKNLFATSKKLAGELTTLVKNKEYGEYFEKISDLVPTIDSYFENTIVMDEDNEVKQNRINQLTYVIAEIFDKVAYLNKLD